MFAAIGKKCVFCPSNLKNPHYTTLGTKGFFSCVTRSFVCFASIDVPHVIMLLMMKDRGNFSHTTRKSTYPQYPVKLKSPSATKSKKTLRIASRMERVTEILSDLFDAW